MHCGDAVEVRGDAVAKLRAEMFEQAACESRLWRHSNTHATPVANGALRDFLSEDTPVKHIQIRRATQAKIATLGALSLAALTQFGSASQSVQAANSWSNGTFRDNNPTQLRRNNNRRRVTMTGRVEDDKRGPNAFVLDAEDGRIYLVDTRNSNEPNLDRGDIVEVRGRISGASIQADEVRVIDRRGNDDDDRRERRERRRRNRNR